MSKFRVAVIGCGGIANGKHLPALKAQSHRCDLVAFCDILEERAVAAAEKYGVPGAKVYTDYRQLLAEVKPDVVHVCTPNRSHADISVAALEAGSHVMCEKPMAKTAADARRMVEAAKKTGKKLTIGYQNRHRPDTIALKRACENGDLGEIYFAKAHALRRRAVPTWGVFLNEYEQGGGPLIDIGTHALDLTLYMMDNYEPASVMGQTFKKLGDQRETGNAFGDWDPVEFTVEDSAFGFIKMKNGATIILESSWALNITDVCEAQTTLCGTKAGADTTKGLRFNMAEYGHLAEKRVSTDGEGVDFFDASSQQSPGERETALWYDALEAGTDPVVLPEQALVVTEILEAIYESAKTGKAVYFD
ncbi:MAG: Gfo/Idh/MocA family oxidoreductase [Clostridia bacterium]|nr:Gfo/Idh/MocA family oxidoreductase [Clostridia bacterium]